MSLRPTALRSSSLVVPAVLALAGCTRDEPRHYSTPKESMALGAPIARAPMPPMPVPGDPSGVPSGMPPEMAGAAPMNAAALPPPEAPAPGAGVGWKLPEKWTQERGSGMRFATIRTADAPPLEISVVTLGGAAGGELANVNRWRGQIGLAPVDDAALAKERVLVKSEAGAIGVFDMAGQGEGASRMIAGILSVPGANTWFFKLTGDAKALEGAKAGFLRFLESVRRE